nr:hypothetical protein [Candidatus Anoxychlamydiales bacterium]
PYILAKLLEIPPNVIINIFHKSMIKSFAPSILEDTLKAVNRSGFTHAINCFLSDIIEDALIEMKKGPYEKTTDEPPKHVDKALSSEIKKFSEFLFTLITREQYQTKDELKRIQKNGLVPKSGIERFLKKMVSPQYVDEGIKYFFVDKALHPNIIELFNFLCQSEKFEEYLCNLIELLNKIYEDVPDTTTPEGLSLLEEHKQKQSQREELVDTLIQEGITQATEDGIHERFETTSKNQDNDIILAYRKVKKKTLEKLPRIQQDAKNILLSCKDLLHSFSPLNSKTPTKEDIEIAKLDLKNLFTVIQNAIPIENDPVKRAMDHQLKDFKTKEKDLLDSLNRVDNLHDDIEQLKSVSKEIKNLKSLFNSKNIDIKAIKESVNALQSLKRSLKFDKMIDKYNFLSDQFEKIQTHEKYISTLQEVLKNTFFKTGLLLELAKAQKEYLNSPKSLSKEKRLKALNEKMLRFLNNLNPIAEDSDISELKDVIRKIYICPNPQKIKTAYIKAKELFEKKLSKHSSLLGDEKVMLKTKCLEKCKSTIKKQENEFSTLFKDSHQNLMENAKLFSDDLNALKNIATDIDKRKQSGLNRKTLIQSAKAGGAAVAAATASYFSHPYLSAASLAISGLYLRKLKPIKWIVTKAVAPRTKRVVTSAAVPLAKASAESAYSVITNSAFYEGLIHAYMKDFIDDNKKSKK